MADHQYVLNYYGAHGRANQIRFALALAGAQWSEPEYGSITDAHWMAEHSKRMFEKGKNLTKNIPLLEDTTSGQVYTQSQAIMRHLARVFPNRLSASETEQLYLIDKLLEDANEIRSLIYSTFYYPSMGMTATYDHVQRVIALDGPLDKYLGNLERYFTEHQGMSFFVVSDRPTIADCAIFDVLESYIRPYFPENWEKFPNLVSFTQRFQQIEQVQIYLSSDTFTKLFRAPKELLLPKKTQPEPNSLSQVPSEYDHH